MNTAADSVELLRDYATTGEEAPFAELVRRHVDLVYSAALRRGSGDAALAAEVAQTVFSDLARKARSPRPAEAAAVLAAASLAGWLYHHTGFVTATAVRSEVRRRDREKTAMLLQAQTDSTDWSRVAPVLEDAMADLPNRDRDALVLRFFEKESFARVGAVLGASEDAARMRVDRALDRLRESLAKRGVTSTAAALASSLTAFGVAPAPAGLAAIIASASAAVVAVPVAGGAVQFVAFKPVVTGLSAVLVVATILTSGYLTLNARSRLAAAARDQAALRTELAHLQAEHATAVLAAVNGDELARLRREHVELLQLRSEVARLRRELAEAAIEQAASTSSPAVAAAPRVPPVQVLIEGKFIEAPDAAMKALGLTIPLNGSEALSESQAKALIQRLEQQEGVEMLSAPRVLTLGGRPAEISIVTPAEGDDPSSDAAHGPSLTMEVVPSVSQDSRQVELTMNVGYTKPMEDASGALGFMQSAHAFVMDGQSVLLRQAAQPRAGTGAPETGPRSLLVLVVPTLMDPAGRRLYPSGSTLPATAETGSPAP